MSSDYFSSVDEAMRYVNEHPHSCKDGTDKYDVMLKAMPNFFLRKHAEYLALRYCLSCPLLFVCRYIITSNRKVSGMWGGAYRDSMGNKLTIFFTLSQWRQRMYGEYNETPLLDSVL